MNPFKVKNLQPTASQEQQDLALSLPKDLRTKTVRKKIKKLLAKKIKLHESENAWRPSCKMQDTADQNTETEKLYKKVRGILNKLTLKNFEILTKQARNLDINTEERLIGVIFVIFEHFIKEPIFRILYANMCKHFALISVPLDGKPLGFQFRRKIVQKCQSEYEWDRYDYRMITERIKAYEGTDLEKQNELQMKFEEKDKRAQMRRIGNVIFISELFKLNMIIEPIMHECLQTLISLGDEESLECFCYMFERIGKELENKCASSCTDSYFLKMHSIITKKVTRPKIRFMLQDMIDLKLNNWVPKRDKSNSQNIDSFTLSSVKRQKAVKRQAPSSCRKVKLGKVKKQNTVPLTTTTKGIQLHKSECAWHPSHKVRDIADQNSAICIAKFCGKVRSILNKLTVYNFEILANQMKNLDINTGKKLQGVTDVVFEQFIKEPIFRILYANMCKHLSSICVPLDEVLGQVSLQQLLITKCQMELNKESNNKLQKEEIIQTTEATDFEKHKDMQMKFEDNEKEQTRRFGIVIFMNELFKLNILSVPIIYNCLNKLIIPADDESLECLCYTLKRNGKELDEWSKKNVKKYLRTHMDKYFAKIQKIICKKLASSRICYMLQEVVDLRKNYWVPKRHENKPQFFDSFLLIPAMTHERKF